MKLFKKLEYLSYRFRYEATYLEMKYQLKRVMKGKKTLYLMNIWHYDRNIGKSCALARLSAKYNIPVIVPTNTWATLYTKDIPHYIPKYFKKKLPMTIVANENLRGRKFDYVLLEECIPHELISNIIAPTVIKGMVGYKNMEIA